MSDVSDVSDVSGVSKGAWPHHACSPPHVLPTTRVPHHTPPRVPRDAQVTLALGRDFEKVFTEGLRVEVRFVLSRVPLQLFHEGLVQVDQLPPSLLFPESSAIESSQLKPPRILTTVLSPFDPKVRPPCNVQNRCNGRWNGIPPFAVGLKVHSW